MATVAADSAKDIANSVGVLVATRIGERLSVPYYGTPDPVFVGVDSGAVTAAVAQWEERANPNDLVVESGDDGSMTVTITTGG